MHSIFMWINWLEDEIKKKQELNNEMPFNTERNISENIRFSYSSYIWHWQVEVQFIFASLQGFGLSWLLSMPEAGNWLGISTHMGTQGLQSQDLATEPKHCAQFSLLLACIVVVYLRIDEPVLINYYPTVVDSFSCYSLCCRL